MSEAFIRIVNMSITASWLVLAVIAVRFLFKKTPKWILCLLWAFVAVRLICPVSIESSLSLIPSTRPLGQEIIFVAETEKPANGEILDAEGTILYEQSAPAANGEILDAEGNVIYKQNLERYHDRTQKQMLLNVLSGIWFAGVGLMFLYTLASYWLLRRKVSTAIAIRKGIYQCDSVDSPFVLGLIRPVIYLPFGMADQDVAYVIAHEQAHIRRKDHWWKPLGFLLLTIHWFNPIMWVAYILLCRDIELACDEKVIEKLGNEQRADYTQALVACSVNRRRIAACPLAFGEVGVKERVKSIMNYRKPAFWVVLLAILACIAVAVCFLTDPIDSAEEPIETDGIQMQQVSFLYDTEEGYHLLIGADGVNEIQVSLPDSGGGVVNADGSSFTKGEKVYLEPLQGITDLRGLSITALGENGEVLYGLSIPEDASMEDVINTVGSDGWLLAPTEHIVGTDIAGKTYVYENEGSMGNFTITLYDDGTFTYYEGLASSYFGVGSWQMDGSIVTLTDDEELGFPLINKFIMDGDDLVFTEQDSSNFIYVKVEEGERFHLTGEAFKDPQNVNKPEPPYPFEATMEEITDQLHELQGLQTETDVAVGDSVNVNDPTMWHEGVIFDELEPNEEIVSPFEISLNKKINSVLFNITWARTGLTLAYGLRSSDGTEYYNAHAGGSGNGQFQNIPAGSYRLFVRNTDYSGVPAYENPDLFPYTSFNATGAMNYKLD